jgi:streptogramin lyase
MNFEKLSAELKRTRYCLIRINHDMVIQSGAATKPIIREHRIPTPGSKPYIITPGPDGNLWFCESGASKIGRITPDGQITEFPLPTPKAGPNGMILAPDGNVWFSESDKRGLTVVGQGAMGRGR